MWIFKVIPLPIFCLMNTFMVKVSTATLMLGITLQWTSILPGGGGTQKYSQLLHANETGISSALMHGLLGSYAELTICYRLECYTTLRNACLVSSRCSVNSGKTGGERVDGSLRLYQSQNLPTVYYQSRNPKRIALYQGASPGDETVLFKRLYQISCTVRILPFIVLDHLLNVLQDVYFLNCRIILKWELRIPCLDPKLRYLVEHDALWVMGLIVRGSQDVLGLMHRYTAFYRTGLRDEAEVSFINCPVTHVFF